MINQMVNQVTETLYEKVRELFPELTTQAATWSQVTPDRYKEGTLILSDGRQFRFNWFDTDNWTAEMLS